MVWVAQATPEAATDHSLLALLIAAVVMAAITVALLIAGRRKLAVALEARKVDLEDGTTRDVRKGDVVPGNVPDVRTKPVTRTWLHSLVIGTDHRLSTSKTIAFAWTYTVAFALIALLVAQWLGDDAGWNALQEKGLQEEYLLALGGPYAAAVLAKYSAIAASKNEGKPAEVPGNAGLGQLFANDAGEADLGDFQYVLFNTIALTWVIVTFLWHLHDALPDIPPVLAGLALTSTGAYTAKKLLAGMPPTLTHAHPPEAPPDLDVQVWGKNLVVPSTAADTPAQLPSVLIGNKPSTTTAMGSSPGGVDRLTVKVPTDLDPGTYILTAMRADGIAATGPGGTNGLSFRVLALPEQPGTAPAGGP